MQRRNTLKEQARHNNWSVTWNLLQALIANEADRQRHHWNLANITIFVLARLLHTGICATRHDENTAACILLLKHREECIHYILIEEHHILQGDHLWILHNNIRWELKWGQFVFEGMWKIFPGFIIVACQRDPLLLFSTQCKEKPALYCLTLPHFPRSAILWAFCEWYSPPINSDLAASIDPSYTLLLVVCCCLRICGIERE